MNGKWFYTCPRKRPHSDPNTPNVRFRLITTVTTNNFWSCIMRNLNINSLFTANCLEKFS
uniref:Uncharacterized protein n=1 Tax=Meloidogyne incognita TaxID=6306 RepID=A0A914M294_MELIC